MAFVETSNLDGETNLKIRKGVEATAGLKTQHDLVNTLAGKIECEPPNKHLDEFVGNLQMTGDKVGDFSPLPSQLKLHSKLPVKLHITY